jgi:signal transduction histidine kinase
MWDRLTILQKGLLLISAPVLFQLAFIAVLANLQRTNAQAVEWSMHSKDVLQQGQVVWRNLLEMGTGLRGFILSSDPELGAAYERAAKQLPLDIRGLEARVADNAEQVAQVQQIAETTRDFMAWHEETIRLSAAGKRDDAVARAKSDTHAHLQEALKVAVLRFVESEYQLDLKRTASLERTRDRQPWFLWIGLGATVIITLGLAFVFSRSIGSRLTTLADNAQRLGQGKALAPPLQGSDEVAQLDRAFRGMAEELNRSADSLRRSSEEVRALYEQARNSEQEIRRLNEDLERRIAERTTELALANEALREADRQKDEFLAMLAHELRNPLAPIRNGLHLMKMPGIGPEPIRQAREMMERQLLHLVRLVDDLLDVGRIIQGKIELRKDRFALDALIHRAEETAQPAIDARGQELKVSLPTGSVYLDGDLVRLAQVLSNLLMNAAKYTDKAGQIWLSARREDSHVLIAVRDTGVGIDPELLPRVFDLFVQGDRSLAHSQGGLGIGLTLARRLVELHGGSVNASSAGVGHGSEFTVRLPALPEAPTKDSTKASDSSKAAGAVRRVLVVDDNVDAAESTGMLLRIAGHAVTLAHDGLAAIAAAREFRPEVVLLDIGLPGISGYEVARELRAQPENERVVIAAVTGYGQDSDRGRSREAGFDYHLTKPLDPRTLTDFVASPRPV